MFPTPKAMMELVNSTWTHFLKVFIASGRRGPMRWISTVVNASKARFNLLLTCPRVHIKPLWLILPKAIVPLLMWCTVTQGFYFWTFDRTLSFGWQKLSPFNLRQLVAPNWITMLTVYNCNALLLKLLLVTVAGNFLLWQISDIMTDIINLHCLFLLLCLISLKKIKSHDDLNEITSKQYNVLC